jgi:hypothetical protein
MVSNVPHDIMIGNQSGAAVQNKPGMLLLIVPLIAFGYFGYGNWNGGGALGLVLVTLPVHVSLPGGHSGSFY